MTDDAERELLGGYRTVAAALDPAQVNVTLCRDRLLAFYRSSGRAPPPALADRL